MILMTFFIAFIAGFWNRPPKLKARRTGRCVCNPWCFENHMECLSNSEVWNSILILSCLSALLPVAEGQAMQALQDLQNALEGTEDVFKKSNATLYTPNTENINECTHKLIDCFLMEMNVLLYEEDPDNYFHPLIERTLKEYECEKKTYYCEQELANSTVFFERMKTFLQKLSSVCQGEPNASATCV